MKDFTLPPEPESIVSVTDRVTQVKLDSPATAVHFLGDVAVFVGPENGVTFAAGTDDPKFVSAQIAGILCSASDGKRV
ncbi:MAG: WD40 repeat domain-containing protein, partial [Rhizobiales bacterium]|nr:WD40 repeat domain-containing protein [Hyphomicrobiales bacterium]